MRNQVDFWLRWHITLTRFLTAYIYNPLSLTLTRRRMAHGRPVLGRQPSWSAFLALLLFPTVLTMFISGLWHGAGYTFILWGLLHGAYLTVNHAWRLQRQHLRRGDDAYARAARPLGWALTFFSVVVSMVIFRAPSVPAAWAIWRGMAGAFGASMPDAVLLHLGALSAWLRAVGVAGSFASGSSFVRSWIWVSVALAVALLAPNTMEILAPFAPALGVKPKDGEAPWWQWRPSPGWVLAIATISAVGILSLGQLSTFIYWQF